MVQQEYKNYIMHMDFEMFYSKRNKKKKRTLFVVTEGDRVRIKHIALKGITYKKMNG